MTDIIIAALWALGACMAFAGSVLLLMGLRQEAKLRATAALAPSSSPRPPFVVEWPVPQLRVVKKPEWPS